MASVKQSQSGTRRAPLTPKLQTLLQGVADKLGVTFEVVSGGQDQRTGYTGSTRHDVDAGNHGGAADVKAYDSNGKALDFSTAAGQKTWAKIAQLARSLGATGIGAAEGYMGSQEMHIGFQGNAREDEKGRVIKNPSSYKGVWGAGGKAANAPSWLREAYDAGGKEGGGDISVEALAPSPAPSPAFRNTNGPLLGNDLGHGNAFGELHNDLGGTPITVHGGASGAAPLLLPSGKSILPGTYPSNDGTHTVTVSDDGSGRAKITHNQQMGEIPGLINPGKELSVDSSSVVGNYLKSFIADNVAPAQAAVASKVANAGTGLAGAGNSLVTDAQGFAEHAAPLAVTVGNAAKGIFGIFNGGVPTLTPQNELGGGTNVPFVSADHPHANGDIQTLPPSVLSGAPHSAAMDKLESIHDANDLKLNPAWTAWNASQLSPTLKKGEMFTSTGGKVTGSQWAAMNYVGDDAYQAPAVLAQPPRAPAPPKYLSVPSQQSQVQAPVDKVAQLVRLLSGRTVPVGTTGTAQGGAYNFVVQKDGSILNKTTGKITAAAPSSSPAPAQNATSKYLGTQGVNTSGLTSGQQANELNKSMSSGSRNEDGSRSFGP